MSFPLEQVPKNVKITRCLVCGQPPTCADKSFMGQIYFGLCDDHKHYTSVLSFGPQFMENATMQVVDPAEMDVLLVEV